MQLTGLIERLDRQRFSPHLCTIRPSDEELNPAHCPHLALNVPRLLSPGGFRAAWQLSRYLKEENFEVVQTFFQDSTIFGGVTARMAGTPQRLACFRDLGFWRTRNQELLLRRVYPLMTGFLANAEIVKESFVQHDGIDPGQIKVIHNGIDLEGLPWCEHNGPTLNVGIVGNLNRRVKRTDLFLKAAALVGNKYPDITWHVLGDGQYRSEYEELARAGGIADRTVFTGRIENVSDYLAKLQVAVLCSDSEGFSNALLEYMLRGCVSVATRVGGNSEALVNNESGLLVPADNAEALAEAIEKMIEDVPLRKTLARQARQSASARFGWQQCVAAHEAVYDQV